MDKQFDLIVIGAGPGGYMAAAAAARLNKRVALVEKDRLGGTCLQRGCIPTKTILHSTEVIRSYQKGQHCGIEGQLEGISLTGIQERKNEVIDQLQGGIEAMLKKAKVSVFLGTAKIQSAHVVLVNEQPLTTQRILIATGSCPVIPPIVGLNQVHVMSSDDLLMNTQPISTLAILGGGVIGCEFAGIYNALGTKVILLEAADRLLPAMDKEIGQSLKQLFKKRGIEVLTSAKVTSVKEGLHIEVEEKTGKRILDADQLLVAVGRKAYTEGLFDENLAPLYERGSLVVNERFETSIPFIYAIGDVIGGSMLAHTATAEGINAVAMMFEQKPSYDLSSIPGCVYTDPEIATVGLTQEEAKAKGVEAIGVKVTMGANGKSVLSNQERGFMKLVVDKDSQRILGAHMMCARATDMISQFTQAIVCQLTLTQLAQTIYPHPTFSEAMGELIEQAKEKLN